MREAKSWQAKHAIIPHYYLKIKSRLTCINLYIYFFVSPCARVFFPEKMQKKKVICEIFMCEAKSWQAKHVIIPHHYIKDEHWLTAIIWPYLCFWFTMCMGPFSWGNTDKIVNLWKFDVWSQISTGKRHDTTIHHYMQMKVWLRCINF